MISREFCVPYAEESRRTSTQLSLCSSPAHRFWMISSSPAVFNKYSENLGRPPKFEVLLKFSLFVGLFQLLKYLAGKLVQYISVTGVIYK